MTLPRDSAGDDCIQCPRADGGTQGALPISKKKIHLPPQLFAFFFTQRVLAMQDRLYRVSCTLLCCEADREDAVQSALEKAWRGRFLLRQEQYMETWLTRILINECYAIMRRSRRIIPMAEVGENQPAQWEAQNADEMLCRALTALPDTLRLPIVLHYMEGMDIRTIARTLRIRESAVKSRLHRGREKLRQSDELKELLEDE